MIALLIALIYIGLMIYLANIEQIRGESHPLLTLMQYSFVIFIAVLILNALAFVVMTPDQVNDPAVAKQLQTVDRAAAMGFVVFGIVFNHGHGGLVRFTATKSHAHEVVFFQRFVQPMRDGLYWTTLASRT